MVKPIGGDGHLDPYQISPDVSIVIPTQRRLSGLAAAVRSIFRQRNIDFSRVELVVVDNDRAPSAQALTESLSAEAPLPLIYVHEPRPGVATARNAAMAVARGAWIAFLDDDEEASEGWLAALLAAREAFGADVVFGPVRTRLPDEVSLHRAYFERFFAREGPAAAGLIDHHYGCGDSLVRRAALPDPAAPFSEARNRSGGEDNLLFSRMQATGTRFAWAPDAWVWEDPVPGRLRLRYTIRRAFAYGQGPTSDCATAFPPNRAGVAYWMAVGAGQCVVFGLLAAFKWLTRAEDRAWALDRAARGLGKLVWWVRAPFYGEG